MNRAHPKCWQGDHYEHVCHIPSGRTCFECTSEAGTPWGPYWCPEHDAERLNRITRQLEELTETK